MGRKEDFRLLLFALLASVGCESAVIETTTAQLDSAQDVALLCALPADEAAIPPRTTWIGTTMDQCSSDGDGHLLAFVVERTRGELAVVDLRTRRLLDLDLREPLASPISVGPQPIAIAASPDGSRLVIANFGDLRPGEDPANPDGLPFLTLVVPEQVLPQMSTEPARIYLPAKASAVAFLDPTHVAITMPALSAVAVVTLADPPVVSTPVVLEPFPLVDPETAEPYPGLPVPWSLLVDPGRKQLLVGDRQAASLVKLTWDDITFALTVVDPPYPLPGPATAMAIEPPGWDVTETLSGRWIYAVDGRAGGVMVLDAGTLIPINLAERDPMEWRSEIVVPGLAQDVVIARVRQKEAPTSPDPTVFHGTFAFIVASVGQTYAVDIEDWAKAACWEREIGDSRYLDDNAHCPRHVLRNASDSEDGGPFWSSAPALFQPPSDTSVPYTDRPDPAYPQFDGFTDTYPPPDGDPSYGVWFFAYPDLTEPDDRRAVSQTWVIEYEAIIPWTDGSEGGQVAYEGHPDWFGNRAMPFCAFGVLAGDHLIIKDGPCPLPLPGEPPGCSETVDCRAYGTAENPGKLEYPIVGAFNNHLELSTIVGGPPFPSLECFPWAVRYAVRLSGQWMVRGEGTGFQHHVIAQDDGTGALACVEAPDAAACPPWVACDDPVGDPLAVPFVDLRCLFTGRAVETAPGSDGVLYRNPYICFSMKQGLGSDGLPKPTDRGMRYELKAGGGFRPVSVETGALPVAAAADTTGRTGPALLVVDSSSDGLIRVGLDGFDVSDNWP